MATGDAIALDFDSFKVDSFEVRVSGIADPIPLTNFAVDQANNLWSAAPVGGSWPVLSPDVHGSTTSPGSVQVVTSATSRIQDVQGNVLAAGTVVFSRAITLTPVAIAGTLSASYVSGLGANGAAITTSNALGSGTLVINIASVEN